MSENEIVSELEDTQETEFFEEERPRRKVRKPILPKIIGFLIFVLIGILGAIVYYYFDCQKPIQSASETQLFVVEENSTVNMVTNKLEAEGFTKNGQMAYYYARLNELTNIYAGEYELDKSWDIQKILSVLNDPLSANQNLVMVSIPEGSWAETAAARIAEQTDVSADDLLALWNNEEWIREHMSEYSFLTEDIFNKSTHSYLEGYLAPDTYEFKADSTAEEITLRLLNQTRLIFQEYEQEANDSGLTYHQLFTLASIVQFEAGGSEGDQKEIAGVFYNRMASEMKLDSSATVCYAINYDPETHDWTECETNADVDNPYNTYMYTGLPPGPICFFSKSSFDATIRPNITSNYYFMADVFGDGTIYYAETYEEHQANVEKYLW